MRQALAIMRLFKYDQWQEHNKVRLVTHFVKLGVGAIMLSACLILTPDLLCTQMTIIFTKSTLYYDVLIQCIQKMLLIRNTSQVQ